MGRGGVGTGAKVSSWKTRQMANILEYVYIQIYREKYRGQSIELENARNGKYI